MPYTLSRQSKIEGRLTPEEEDVRDALANYSDDPSKAKLTDFVTFHALYVTYLRYVGKYQYQPGDPDRLTRRAFGAALMRVFPYLDEDRWKRVQRTLKGKREFGFIGLQGPASITVCNDRGNPNFKAGVHEAAPAPAEVQGR